MIDNADTGRGDKQRLEGAQTPQVSSVSQTQGAGNPPPAQIIITAPFYSQIWHYNRFALTWSPYP
jgi:hypothetical protein